ncbi:MAG: peptidoglycan-binding protein [Microscillaceae bacterium]|nr:peptidoglycan-binding protein [Microscillaceae bacterium]
MPTPGSPSQELKKLVIGPKGQASPAESDRFTALVNPASMNYTVNIVFAEQNAPGTDGSPAVYSHTQPESLSFSLDLDGTGVIDPSAKPVPEQIEQFKKVTLQYQRDQHKPNDVTISWGTLAFDCMLRSLDINYTMFKPDGTPLRAKLNVSFVGTLQPRETEAAQAESPDLTHRVLVKAGDSLPLLCQRIYGDSRFYLEIARLNGLVNFRNLQPGQELEFPPILK